MSHRHHAARARFACAVPVLAALALTACAGDAGNEEESAVPSVSATPVPLPSASPMDPTPDPESTRPTEALPIPECDALIDLEDIRLHVGESAEAFPPIEHYEDIMPGPSANAALAQASEVRSCQWGVPQSDTGVVAVASVVPPEELATLESALRADGFDEGERDGAVVFTSVQPGGGLGDVQLAYIIDGDIWTAAFGSVEEEGAVELAGLLRESVVASQNSRG